MKIKIGGIVYKVVFKSHLKDGKIKCWGYVNYQTSTIYITKGLSKQKTKQTIIHECLHALLHEAGLDEYANDEKIVLPLGNLLYQFENDNK